MRVCDNVVTRNPLSYLFYFWPFKTIWNVFRRGHIVDSDIPSVGARRSAETRYNAMLRTVERNQKEEEGKDVPEVLTLTSVFIRHRAQLSSSLMTLLQIGAQLRQPYVVEDFIDWFFRYTVPFSDPSSAFIPRPSRSDGWAIFTEMAVLVIANVFLNTHKSAKLYDLGLQQRSGIIALLFNKVQKISAGILGDSAASAVVSLAFSDTDTLVMYGALFPMIWSLPLQVVIAFILLIRKLDSYWAPLSLIGVCILLIPFIGTTVGKMMKFYAAQMGASDRRVNRFTEILGSIGVIKKFGFESFFSADLGRLRQVEVDQVGGSIFAHTTLMGMLNVLVIFASGIMMGVWALFTDDFQLSVMFAGLSLSMQVLFPLAFSSMVMSFHGRSVIALNRINAFLALPEHGESHEEVAIEQDDLASVQMKINEAFFPKETNVSALMAIGNKKPPTVTEEAPVDPVELADDVVVVGEEKSIFALRNITLNVKPGELVGLIGAVGTGKTAMLQTLLNEMDGSYTSQLRGSVAYCSQTAWLISGTIKENIIGQFEYEEEKYNKVVDACCLLNDFATLVAGDETLCGESGATLSGGQKQRVALARAVYADADIVILDDVISALDAHVGRRVMQEVVFGMLADKTVILATHQSQHLFNADHIIALANGDGENAGQIEAEGTYQELFDLGLLGEAEEAEETTTAESTSDLVAQGAEKAENAGIDDVSSEQLGSGSVKFSEFMQYFKPGGGLFPLTIWIICSLCAAAMTPLAIWYISNWVSSVSFGTTPSNSEVYKHIGIYTSAGLIYLVFIFIANKLLERFCVKASRQYHDGMLQRVFRAPMKFFDTTPIGRITNRFSKDLTEIDGVIPQSLGGFVSAVGSALARIVTMGISSWQLSIALVGIVIFYVFGLLIYLPGARDLKRVDSARRSPVIGGVQDAIQGVISSRAAGMTSFFFSRQKKAIDHAAAATHTMYYTLVWNQLVLYAFGALCTLSTLLIFILGSKLGDSAIDFAMASVALVLSMQLPDTLRGLTQNLASLQQAMAAVERVREYTEGNAVPQEADLHTPVGQALDSSWPDGSVSFRDVKMRYREELPLVLKGVSFDVAPGEKLGVVGRSGAGKSTLTEAIFRTVEIEDGVVSIGGVDTKTLGLHDLRHHLAIIPQDPVLFAGPLRATIDPEGKRTDVELWSALEAAQLKTHVSGLEGGLDFELTAGGANLSAGQRQLVCLARALVRRSKLLLCDEVTASVDAASDRAVQTAIATGFADATVITIAHRLGTVATCDRVLVMSDGEIAELDTPKALLESDGVFASMCRAAGSATYNEVASICGAQCITPSDSASVEE